MHHNGGATLYGLDLGESDEMVKILDELDSRTEYDNVPTSLFIPASPSVEADQVRRVGVLRSSPARLHGHGLRNQTRKKTLPHAPDVL